MPHGEISTLLNGWLWSRAVYKKLNIVLQYAIAADVDEVDLYKKVVRFNKEKWISVTHNHPEGDFSEDGVEIIKAIEALISIAK